MGMIGTSQAASKLGITQRRVVALITAGRLEAIRIGRTWVINSKDLRAVRVRKVGRPSK